MGYSAMQSMSMSIMNHSPENNKNNKKWKIYDDSSEFNKDSVFGKILKYEQRI